ncbi:MAG: arginase family protein, partial [Clostridia bacterium]|nr:arginase family protein [Clostridia bacterium]
MNKNVQTFIGCDAEFDEAAAVIFGAPFDGTTSFRPGTRFGPSAIRAESFGIETYSPYCDRDLCEVKVLDGGDL